jgi:putative transcriptional regulator
MSTRFCGDCCHGSTERAVLKQLGQIESDWIENFAADKRKLPPISSVPLAKKKKATDIRLFLAMNQIQFAALLSISVKTLHEWEQGTSNPSGAARTLLDLVATHPEIILASRLITEAVCTHHFHGEMEDQQPRRLLVFTNQAAVSRV